MDLLLLLPCDRSAEGYTEDEGQAKVESLNNNKSYSLLSCVWQALYQDLMSASDPCPIGWVLLSAVLQTRKPRLGGAK